MSFTWNKTPAQAWDMNQYREFVIQAMYMLLLSYAGRVEADMKDSASWTDRTGNARQTLAAFAIKLPDGAVLIAKQQMSYGKWLELKNAGKYAIVLRTLQSYYGTIWQDVKAIIE